MYCTANIWIPCFIWSTKLVSCYTVNTGLQIYIIIIIGCFSYWGILRIYTPHISRTPNAPHTPHTHQTPIHSTHPSPHAPHTSTLQGPHLHPHTPHTPHTPTHRTHHIHPPHPIHAIQKNSPIIFVWKYHTKSQTLRNIY